ncbi:Asp23/Gls24 family envelope stress response protein [Natranaerobius trueperi]|uniref:Asp23/Gls24 family envelope stress response protein n=1 Tax=Natranaerobius trueperi TaxID=759412 RepID=A0A226C1H0_9FIRM|nr:Asp23/Gls24 family envelope stress response protein [Natranaerobius trueperi]OWZ84872.1 Asp23/Gls24 family envelope stress response protein [Natranaerobius trueperi]
MADKETNVGKVNNLSTAEKEDNVEIVDDVIAIIAGIAANKVEGVKGMTGGSFVGNIAERMGKKDLGKGVKITTEENEVHVAISIVVQYGVKIHETAKEVQKAIREAIQSMTGLEVPAVQVNVQGVEMDQESESEYETME